MSDLCLNCGHAEKRHGELHSQAPCWVSGCDCPGFRDEPSDDEVANRPGVEGGIGYPLGPEPMDEHDWRL